MGKALYRKYRSRSLNEIVGQEHITDTLSRALAQGRVSHAYLLTGQRGTGKTSVARILAHSINELPYSEDPHFDIIEIDAASNNGVEDVRSLREKVQSAPTSAKYKVYIIDEVHMLSKAAFNALLKTLEEPPEHAVFILATTEVHKLPETIISRTQRYSFRPVEQEKVTQHLKSIAKKEKFAVDDDALKLIAEHGGGSFRDSISLLDQASSLSDHVTLPAVEQLLGRAPAGIITQLVSAVYEGNSTTVANSLNELLRQGYDAATISAQLGASLRQQLASPGAQDQSATLKLLRELLSVPGSQRPQEYLELTLLSHAVQLSAPAAEVSTTSSTLVQPRTHQANEVNHTPVKTTDEVKLATVAAEDNSADTSRPENPEPTSKPDSSAAQPLTGKSADELWAAVLIAIKEGHNTLYGVARMVKPRLSGDELTLATKFPFHQKRLNEAKNRSILAEATTKLRGRETSIVCVVDSTATPTAAKVVAETSSTDLQAISNIFGGAELI